MPSAINATAREVRQYCHVDQEASWSCGLAAIQSVMRFFSYDPPSGNGLIRLLRSYGLGGAIEEGLSTPHLAFIVRRLVRCQLKVYLHPESLREVGGQWSRCPLPLHRPIKPLKDINPIWAKGLNRAIQELRSDGVLVTVGSYGLQSVTSGLTEFALIVKVRS